MQQGVKVRVRKIKGMVLLNFFNIIFQRITNFYELQQVDHSLVS